MKKSVYYAVVGDQPDKQLSAHYNIMHDVPLRAPSFLNDFEIWHKQYSQNCTPESPKCRGLTECVTCYLLDKIYPNINDYDPAQDRYKAVPIELIKSTKKCKACLSQDIDATKNAFLLSSNLKVISRLVSEYVRLMVYDSEVIYPDSYNRMDNLCPVKFVKSTPLHLLRCDVEDSYCKLQEDEEMEFRSVLLLDTDVEGGLEAFIADIDLDGIFDIVPDTKFTQWYHARNPDSKAIDGDVNIVDVLNGFFTAKAKEVADVIFGKYKDLTIDVLPDKVSTLLDVGDFPSSLRNILISCSGLDSEELFIKCCVHAMFGNLIVVVNNPKYNCTKYHRSMSHLVDGRLPKVSELDHAWKNLEDFITNTPHAPLATLHRCVLNPAYRD